MVEFLGKTQEKKIQTNHRHAMMQIWYPHDYNLIWTLAISRWASMIELFLECGVLELTHSWWRPRFEPRLAIFFGEEAGEGGFWKQASAIYDWAAPIFLGGDRRRWLGGGWGPEEIDIWRKSGRRRRVIYKEEEEIDRWRRGVNTNERSFCRHIC